MILFTLQIAIAVCRVFFSILELHIIELSRNAVLTLNGNYLYVNDEKTFANVEILREADKRIGQLNRIIDGANNAYDSGVIDKSRRNSIKTAANASIKEYEQVAKGEKFLNNVSEVKKSYTAKV